MVLLSCCHGLLLCVVGLSRQHLDSAQMRNSASWGRRVGGGGWAKEGGVAGKYPNGVRVFYDSMTRGVGEGVGGGGEERAPVCQE